MEKPDEGAYMTDPHDQRAIALLRDDVAHYRALWRAMYHVCGTAYNRIAVLERQLAETREELRRYGAEKVRPAADMQTLAQHTRDYARFLERAR